MVKKEKRMQAPVQRNFDSLKRFYGVPPVPLQTRKAVPSFYPGAYSRRSCLSTFHLTGSSREQLVVDAMRTYTPSTCTKEVQDLFLEVAELVSVYYDTLDHLATLPVVGDI